MPRPTLYREPGTRNPQPATGNRQLSSPSAYARAGVDIDKKMAAIGDIKRMVKQTAVPGVLSDIGLFGGLFASPGAGKILVASTDGVGTKLKVAVMARRHDTVGQDIVNHCVNDILVQGAFPLFFMDYIGSSHFDPMVFRDVIAGLCKACRENDCALLGGETAEMPGLYPPGEYDLVGTIVGVVDRDQVITGEQIRPGDVLIGLPSSGFHTNGYSLVRRILFEKLRLKVTDPYPGTGRSVADVLLTVHRSYLKPVRLALQKRIPLHGMAHITGGGFPDNIVRILPEDAVAVVDRRTWRVPPAFAFIQEKGRVDRDEMYRVFNMGIGFILFVSASRAPQTLSALCRGGYRPICMGQVKRGRRNVVLAG